MTKVYEGERTTDGVLVTVCREGERKMTCEICHRPLTDPISVRRRIGPVCILRHRREQQERFQDDEHLLRVNWAHMPTLCRRVADWAAGWGLELPDDVSIMLRCAVNGAMEAERECERHAERGLRSDVGILNGAACAAESAAETVWDWMKSLNGRERTDGGFAGGGATEQGAPRPNRGEILYVDPRAANLAANLADLVNGLTTSDAIEREVEKNSARWEKAAQRVEQRKLWEEERREKARLASLCRGAPRQRRTRMTSAAVALPLLAEADVLTADEETF